MTNLVFVLLYVAVCVGLGILGGEGLYRLAVLVDRKRSEP